MYTKIKLFCYSLVAFYGGLSCAAEGDSGGDDEGWLDGIGSSLYDSLVSWISDFLEGVRDWILKMFQDMLDEILKLLIELLPKEITDTTISIPDGLLDILAFVGAVFPVTYAAALLTSYSTFKMSFWVYRKCLGFFGLVKPKFAK